MSIAQLLGTMSADLSEADLNAIRKARGFSVKETASRDSFASFFVSSIGVQEVMRSLSPEEIITLHLLNRVGEVDIAFFARLYGSAGQSGEYYYGTFTQRYRPTFDAVKKNLVRKGLLAMAEIKLRAESVQMERWRFALPPEFAAYLPPILPSRQIDKPGEASDLAVRQKLLQLTGETPTLPNDKTVIRIQEDSIYLGDQPFTAEKLAEWQTLAWQSASDSLRSNVFGSVSPVEVVISLFADLKPGEWVNGKSLEPVLKIFSFGYKIPPADKLLKLGWELGRLARLNADSVSYYRLAQGLSQTGLEKLTSPLPWLQVSANRDEAAVDLRLIPFDQLERLNRLMKISGKAGKLLASPDLIKLSRTFPSIRQAPLSAWLAKAIPAYREALDQVNERWGKTLIHDNLLVARVRDLSLRVQLERELGKNIVVLNDHFIAFPTAYRSIVERVLKKAGFVIKTVKV